MIRLFTLAFIIGSSLIPCSVTYMYMLRAYYNSGSPQGVIPFEKSWVVPLLFGLFNTLNVLIQMAAPTDVSPYVIAFMVGAIQGTTFSIIGHQIYHFPRRVFGFNNEWNIYFFSAPLYGLVYVLIIQPLNNYLL